MRKDYAEHKRLLAKHILLVVVVSLMIRLELGQPHSSQVMFNFEPTKWNLGCSDQNINITLKTFGSARQSNLVGTTVVQLLVK